MFDEEIEKAVLHYMIFEKENFDLSERDFANTEHKKMIVAINELKNEKLDLSILNISNKMKCSYAGIVGYIASLGDYVFGTAPEVAYNKLIEYSKKRQAYELLANTMKKMKESEDEKIDISIEKMIKSLQGIQQRNEKVMNFKEQVFKTFGEIEDNYKKRSDYSLYTGLVEIDKMMLGLHKQELTVIGARPGVGKTTIALQIAEHIARKGLHIGFVSLEMSETQLIQKMVSKVGQVDGYRLKSGILEDHDFEKIARVCSDISELHFHVISKVRTIQDIEVRARKLKNKNELDVLIVDYLQLIKSSSRFGNREQEVSEISRMLKLLSLELEIPIIALCQLNRNATRNEPCLADLRESGAIEQDADNVIFLYRKEGEDESAQPIVVAKIAKQRTGDVGSAILLFKKAQNEFVSLVK